MPGWEECVINIPAQTPSSSVSYTNEGLGEDSVVLIAESADELTFSVDDPNENFFCSLVAEGMDSVSFSHELTFSGGAEEPFKGVWIAGDEV